MRYLVSFQTQGRDKILRHQCTVSALEAFGAKATGLPSVWIVMVENRDADWLGDLLWRNIAPDGGLIVVCLDALDYCHRGTVKHLGRSSG